MSALVQKRKIFFKNLNLILNFKFKIIFYFSWTRVDIFEQFEFSLAGFDRNY